MRNVAGGSLTRERGFSGFSFRSAVFLVLLVTCAVAFYPFLYTFSTSISDPSEVVKGHVWLLPRGFSLEGYQAVFESTSLLQAYLNTIIYAAMGTVMGLALSTLAAYPLSRGYLIGRRILNLFIVIPLLFTGGIIPLYVVTKAMGLVNTRWAVVLPVAVRSFYIILMLNFFKAIPEDLHDAARIDGCGEWQVLHAVVLPLSKPILATIGVYTAVDRWNDFFIPLVFIRDTALQPLTLLLRRLLIQGDSDVSGIFLAPEMIKSAVVIATILPILFVYPFAQKYFVKGSMIGAIKQ